MTLIFISAKTRMLLENGNSGPRLKTRIPRYVRNEITTNSTAIRYLSLRRLLRSFRWE